MIYSLGLMLGVGVIAGIFGAILGIGGGMIVTPILTLGLGLDIKYAIGASIIAVIATSSGSTIAYLRDEMLNLRVAMFLEIATTVGAVLGGDRYYSIGVEQIKQLDHRPRVVKTRESRVGAGFGSRRVRERCRMEQVACTSSVNHLEDA